MKRFFILGLLGLGLLGCGGNNVRLKDGGVDEGVDMAANGCPSPAPNCFGNNTSQCCGQDPSGQATCDNGQWMCGSALAPGCNGTSCLFGGDLAP